MSTEKLQVEEIQNPAGETEAVIVTPEPSPEMEPTPPSENEASDAVAIAAIEADKEIRVAEINAETATELAEIAADERAAEHERELTWQEEIADLRTNIAALVDQVTALQLVQASTPPQSTEAEALETAEEIATEALEAETNNSTPEFMSPGTSEIETEVTLESGDEKPVEAEVTVRKRRRLI